MLPQELVDAITPAFALKVTRLHDFHTVLLAVDGTLWWDTRNT